MNELETSSIEEIRQLQGRIIENAHKAVIDAQRIGQILKEVRERVPGADIGQWTESNCGITKSTAYRYIQLFEYRYKIPTVGNSQEAYTQISCLTKKEKEDENKNANSRIDEYKKAGVKPKGWRRGTDDKLVNKDEEATA